MPSATSTTGELWLKGANISEYFYGSYNNHAARRDRKLLLNRKELRKLEAYVQSPGVTIVPVKIFINDRGLAKVVIAPRSREEGLRQACHDA